MDESMTDQGNERARTVDRRTLIKGAAAAGVIVWTAPMIIDSMASPAAAGTPAAGCFKYQYNWWLRNPANPADMPDQGTPADFDHNLMLKYNAATGPGFHGHWNEECRPSGYDTDTQHPQGHLAGDIEDPPDNAAEGYKSNQKSVNATTCCKGGKPPFDQPFDWWQSEPTTGAERIDTFPTPECIVIEVLKNNVVQPGVTCGSLDTGDGFGPDRPYDAIRFRSECPGCFLLDPSVTVAKDPFGTPSFPDNNKGEGKLFTSIQFNFTSLAYPVYFKMWVRCAGPTEDCGLGTSPLMIQAS
jgi:hypothetical protein